MAIDQPSDASSHSHACEEGLAIVVGQQSVEVDECYDSDSEINLAPLNVVRPESMGSKIKKCPGGRFKERAQRIQTYKRKRGRPEGSESAKSDEDVNFVPKEEGLALIAGQKSVEVDGFYDSDSEINLAPLNVVRPESMGSEIKKCPGGRVKERAQRTETYKRKRRKPEGSKSAKSEEDVNFVPKVPDADGRKKYTRVQGICGPASKKVSEVQEKFPGEYPIFTRCMVPSNVLSVFWLHISSTFCRRYLPKHDVIMTLEDEDGQRDYVKYKSGSHGLSGGWRRFATDRSLKVDDTVIFQLVMPTKFKVYIRRNNESTTTNDDVRSKEDPGVTTRDSHSAPVGDVDNQASDVDDVDDMTSPDLDIEDSEGVPSFKDFNIFIDSLLVNPELFPDRLRGTYYKLCCDQKALLHRNLPTKINRTLVMGVIMQTAKIAEGIGASASSHEDLTAWKKILESFELLGMDVGFLRKHVDDLLGITTAWPSTDQPSVKDEGYQEVKLEKDHAAEKMRALKSRMSTLIDALNAVEVEVEEMELSAKKIAQAIEQMANAPW
ncbi:unnamed protein product [Alopecurus aequalis]